MYYIITLIILLLYQPAQAQVKIYRDTWGVPHIHAQTLEEVMYGFGYAQAEDALPTLLKNYRIATGTMAEAFGAEFLNQDFQQRIWQHKKIAQQRYSTIAPDVRIYIESFVAGIRDYMQQNPEYVPQWAQEPSPSDVVALGHHLAYQTLLQQANSEYTGKPLPFHTGNQWAISAKRSAEDAVMICADPFTNFQTSFRPYEAHLHSKTIRLFGFATLGLPIFTTGHNQTLGWSSMAGGADAADVYEITLDSPIANRYKYDQQWRPIVTDTITIAVRTENSIKQHRRLYQRTHHGPIMHRDDNRAYAYRLALTEDVRQIEQYFRLMTAPDQKSFYNALSDNHLSPRRIIYGDVYGNIAYFLTGRIPKRLEFYPYNRPVTGNTSETEWQGIHTQDDLPQLVNPRSEWLQDCDASPDRMTHGIVLTAPFQPAYLSRYLPQTESDRSFRARNLIAPNARVTLAEVISYTQDTYAIHSERWIRALNIAINQTPQFAHSEALALLNRWDGRATSESIGMTLYTDWRARCTTRGRDINTVQILSAQPLGTATARALRETFSETVRHFERTYGRLTVYWKEIHRHRQGDQTWPLVGSAFGLRNIQNQITQHTREGIFGPTRTTIMCLRRPNQIESHTIVPLGQSDNPKSKHYADQAETYASAKLKPTQFGISPHKLTLQHTLHKK